MSATSRLLQMLELLQSRPLSAPDLADRLQTTTRTVRRDVDRLRDLGYTIETRRGSSGGYRLAPGSELPPMAFTDSEAVAIAVALSTAATSTAVTGLDELALSALTKVERLLPSHLRRRIRALRAATASSGPITADTVDPEVLAVVALACRDQQRLRLRYTSAAEQPSRRRVEPHKLVSRARRWYLVCWDLDRQDWRTLRADRIADPLATGQRSTPRPLPVEDAADFLDQQLQASGRRQHTATIVLDTTFATARNHLGRYAGDLSSDGERTRWTLRDDRLEVMASALVWLPWPFTVLDCPELTTLLDQIAVRFAGAGPPIAG